MGSRFLLEQRLIGLRFLGRFLFRLACLGSSAQQITQAGQAVAHDLAGCGARGSAGRGRSVFYQTLAENGEGQDKSCRNYRKSAVRLSHGLRVVFAGLKTYVRNT